MNRASRQARKIEDVGRDGADWKLVPRCGSASLIRAGAPTARLPFLRVVADPGGFAIDLPQAWLDDNPLSVAALESKLDHWKVNGIKLERGAAYPTRRCRC